MTCKQRYNGRGVVSIGGVSSLRFLTGQNGTRLLSLSVCPVINFQIDLGDVTGMNSAIRLGYLTETNCTQAPKQQTAGN